jgi:DNA-directed RNA polymerase II subunit RPB4
MDDMMDIETNSFKLDKEFEKCESCTNFQLFAILKGKDSLLNESEINPILGQTKAYIERFNKYGVPDSNEKLSTKAYYLRNLLWKPERKLSSFEEAQLIDLLPTSADEAFSLIPSLRNKLDSNELQNYLDQLQKMSSSIHY